MVKPSGTLVVLVVQGEVQQRPRRLLGVRPQHGTVLLGGELRQLGGEGLVPLPFQGEEDVHLLLVHDHVLDGGGDAVYRLGLADRLDILVLHRGGERRRPGHRQGQRPQHRHRAAGPGEGREQVHQQHKAQKAGRQAPGGDAEDPHTPVPSPAAQGPAHRAVQGRRRELQLIQKGLIFLVPGHGSPSSPSSNRSSSNARRWRVAAVPWGMSRAAAVSAWVYPAKNRRITTARSSSGRRRTASFSGRAS